MIKGKPSQYYIQCICSTRLAVQVLTAYVSVGMMMNDVRHGDQNDVLYLVAITFVYKVVRVRGYSILNVMVVWAIPNYVPVLI